MLHVAIDLARSSAMSWFTNLKLLPKLMLSFGAVLALTTLLGLFSQRQLASLDHVSAEISTNWMPSIEALGHIAEGISSVRMAGLAHILAVEEKDKIHAEADVKRQIDDLNKDQATYVKLISSPNEQALYDAFKAEWGSYMMLQDQFKQASSIGEAEQARVVAMGKGREAFERSLVALQKIIVLNHQGGVDASAEAGRVYGVGTWSILAAIGTAVVIGFGLALAVARSLTSPLKQVVDVLDQVSQGDLTQRVRHDRHDELGDMQVALDRMVESLSSMVSQVRMGADSVATASTQIAQGNTDLSSRTEQQASNLEETAASVEQMSGTVRTNADNAHQANQLASAASEVAARGGDVVTQVISTMNDIQSSSRKISDIIGVIDGIAFQTNILALNAAVEAARAGEQGRGFAVVAGEVRSLAQRSAQAAREIKTLINDSVEKVNAGSNLVSTAGDTMNDVVLQVRKVTDLVGEIAHASTEQSQGIGQINQAVSQLDQMTQQNAALVEESMAAAESLKVQADGLAQAVSAFRTSQSRDAEQHARKAIDSAQRKSVSSTPARPAPARNITPVKPIVKAAQPARSAAQPVMPQLPSPQASTTSSASADDWETF
jgi:methyl-accepting chemotaxis protein